MAKIRQETLARLDALRGLLEIETEEARRREAQLREGKSLRALEEDGLVARKITPGAHDPQMLGRARITFTEDPNRKGHLDGFAGRPGSVVRLVTSAEEGEAPTSGVIVPSRRGTVAVVFDEHPDLDDEAPVDLILSTDEVTYHRLRQGLDAAADSSQLGTVRLVEMLLGEHAPRPTPTHVELSDKDSMLNEDQRAAVRHGVGNDGIALVHGPFGTGKTRVLIEIVRQRVALGQKILCATASNAAVDHLALSLLESDPALSLVRVGHPARAHPELEAHTAAALTDRHPDRQVAKGLADQAMALLKKAQRRSSQGRRRTPEERAMQKEARELFAEARRLERRAAHQVIDRATIVCGTLTGFTQELPATLRFDVAVIDEASQALTPAVILAALKADALVLAGDHRQLPPTVLSPAAAKEGLSKTVFETLMELESAPSFSHMLTVQHRMNEELMRFPSEQFYEGRLTAHDSVASIALTDLQCHPHPLINEQLCLEVIDTAGAGMSERSDPSTESKHNPEQAGLVGRLVRALSHSGLDPRQVGVIAPYTAQVAELRRVLSDLVEQGLEIDSVDAFQGREKESIVFDTVRSNAVGEIGFLGDLRRLNVAITRAKRKLILVGDSATLSSHPTWAELFEQAMAWGAYRSSFELTGLD